MQNNQLKVGTDFSGLGSPEEALKRLLVNYSVEFACEKDKYARQSYLENHNPKVFYDDVTTRDNSKAGYTDLYVFGFPCQAFSNAGKKLGFQDTRGTLFFNSLDYINQNRPRVFIAENVKGLLSHDKKKGTKGKYGNTFNTILDCLAITANGQYNLHKYDDCVNYHVCYAVLNTKNYEIPQNRERIFIVGFRDEADAINFRMPKAIPLELRLKDLLQDNPHIKYNFSTYEVDEKYYLSEKMISWLTKHTENSKDKGNGFKFTPRDLSGVASCINTRTAKMGVDDNYIYVPEATKQGYAVAYAGDSINLSNPNSKTRRGRVGVGVANTLDTACNQAVVTNELVLYGNIEGVGNEMRSRVYDVSGISPTVTAVTAVQGGGHEPKVYTGTRIRRLTPRECFRLQGYADYFFDNCAAIQSDSQLYKQAGNSITVDTIMHLLRNVLTAIGFVQN